VTTHGASTPQQEFRSFRYGVIAALAGALVVVAIAGGFGLRDYFSTDPTLDRIYLASGNTAAGGSLRVNRSSEDASYRLTVSGLPSGHVITVRAMIFNQPARCSQPQAGARCGEADLADAATDSSVVLAGAIWLRNMTGTTFEGTLSSKAPLTLLSGGGLTNPRGADIVFVVMDHGAPISGRYAEQLQTFRGGCTDPAPGEQAGPVDCADLQYAVSEAR